MEGIRRVDSSYISGASTPTFQVITYNIPTFLPIFSIKSTNMSNPFEIAAQVLATPSSTSLAPRPGPKAKPLAVRQSLSALQLTRPHLNPIMTTTTDGLLAQFKANDPTEIDSDSDNPDIRRRSYTREQKLAAVGYATTKRVCQKGEMVPISHKQACKDLGVDPVQLRRWKKDVDKIRSLHKGSRKGKLFHPAQYPVLEDRLHALILEKRRLGRNVREKWIRQYTRLQFESLWLERVTIVKGKKVFTNILKWLVYWLPEEKAP